MVIAITNGFVVNKVKCQSLYLSSSLFKDDDDIEFYLVIYSINPKFTRITCYPLQTNSVWKFSIRMEGIQQETLDFLTNSLKDFKIIHTTGICEKEEAYFVEYYVYPHKNWSKATQTVQSISQSERIDDISAKEIQFSPKI